jgi:radical SAM superfamily enzyme YgiQ (UPF0313 family)
MPHVALVAFSGLRVREEELLELGMSLPGLRRRGKALAALPSLGLLTLAGMTPSHWTCSYHEADGDTDDLAESVAAERPDVVAISALTASILEAYRFSAAMRRRGILVVIGGLHATVCADEAKRHCDAVVVGEGEPVWLQVLADAEAGSLRHEYRPTAPFNLAESPTPRFELLGDRKRLRLTIQTERGCPLACDFCAASRLLGPFREKPIANIDRELDAIRKIDTKPWLELADDNTFVGSRQTSELFEALSVANTRYFTEADWRIGEQPDVLSGLANSGCVQVLIGIESLVFRYPGMGAKRAELNRIMDAVEAIQAAGVAVNGCFIVGADGETRESMNRLVQFALDSPLAEIQITIQTPFPGTMMYERLRQSGRLLTERDWSHYTLFDVVYQPDQISVVELEEGFRDVLRGIFSAEATARRAAIRRRIWKKIQGLSMTAQSETDVVVANGEPLTIVTLGRFLIGNSSAILTIAGSRAAIWIGLLFVISAGFAREYDGEYLLAEPWHLLLPLGASLVSSLVLFMMLCAVAWSQGARPPIVRSYRSFLGLYWMTAPLAWLYAVPFERFLSAGGAMQLNLVMLGIVSLWRVVLMTRIVAVVFRCRIFSALMVVMLFADAVAMIVLHFTPLPILNIMGGIRLSESEAILQSTACWVQLWGMLTLPVWGIGTLFVLGAGALAEGANWYWETASHQADSARARKGLWSIAGASLVVGLVLLPSAQHEQRNRWRVEQALLNGRISEALETMSALTPNDFPPHWDPPPRIAYGETKPDMNIVMHVLATEGAAGWVLAMFLEKKKQAESD